MVPEKYIYSLLKKNMESAHSQLLDCELAIIGLRAQIQNLENLDETPAIKNKNNELASALALRENQQKELTDHYVATKDVLQWFRKRLTIV